MVAIRYSGRGMDDDDIIVYPKRAVVPTLKLKSSVCPSSTRLDQLDHSTASAILYL